MVLEQFEMKNHVIRRSEQSLFELVNIISNFSTFLLNTISNKFNRKIKNNYVNKNTNNRSISDYPIAKLHFWPIHNFVDLAKKINFLNQLQITQCNE